MPGVSLDWLLYGSLYLRVAGAVGTSFYYWWNCEYKLAVVFLCYAVANGIFTTITGVK